MWLYCNIAEGDRADRPPRRIFVYPTAVEAVDGRRRRQLMNPRAQYGQVVNKEDTEIRMLYEPYTCVTWIHRS